MSIIVFLQDPETSESPTDERSSTNTNSSRTSVLHNQDNNDRSIDSIEIMYQSEKCYDSFPDGGKKANLVLLGSFVGLIADFGIPTSMGAMESYISQNQLKNESKMNVSWIFSLHLGVMFFGGVFFGELFDKYGAKTPLLISTICITSGLVLTAQSRTLLEFILSYSVLTAIGTSMGMAPLIGSLSHWFLKRRGVACSIATVGGLVGGAIFPIMLQRLYKQIGFQWAIRVLACTCLLCMSLSIILVRERKYNNPPNGSACGVSTIKVSSLSDDIESNKYKDILKSTYHFFCSCLDLTLVKDLRFVFLTFAVAIVELVSLSTLTIITSYAIQIGMTHSQAYLLIAVINLTGIPSRLITGYIADKYGRFNVMILGSIFSTLVIFGLWLPAKSNVPILFAFAVLFGISTSTVMSLVPACIGQICSSSNFGKVYGTLYCFLSFLIILGMFVASLIIGRGTVIDYRNFIIYQGCICFVSALLWIIARYTAIGWKWSIF